MANYTQPTYDFADLIPIGEWKECVKKHLIIPYDGTGYYVKDGKENGEADCFDLDACEDATHVAWYSK